MRRYRIEQAVEVVHHFAVPEADHPEALRFDVTRAPRISIERFGVLAAVDFDHELVPEGQEIGNVGADRRLPTKLCFRERLAQRSPENAFGVGHVAAQAAGPVHRAGRGVAVDLHTADPHPSAPAALLPLPVGEG